MIITLQVSDALRRINGRLQRCLQLLKVMHLQEAKMNTLRKLGETTYMILSQIIRRRTVMVFPVTMVSVFAKDEKYSIFFDHEIGG